MLQTIISWDVFGLVKDPVGLHPYGLLIATGFIFAMMISGNRAPAEGEDTNTFNDLAFPLLLIGLLGARTVYIIVTWHEYAAEPLSVFNPLKGGLVFYGGPIFAIGYLIYWCHRNNKNFFKYGDIYAPVLALAHSFGRLGCLAAGCCHGGPTDAAWGIKFPAYSPPLLELGAAHNWGRTPPFDEMVHQNLAHASDLFSPALHPTQLYEAGFELLMFAFLIYMRDKKRFHGQIFLLWLSIYPIFRTINETFRGDSVRGDSFFGFLSTSQIISIGAAVAAVAIFFVLRYRRGKAVAELGLELSSSEPAGASG